VHSNAVHGRAALTLACPVYPPCPTDTYNSLNGFAGDCTTCPGAGAGTWTSYAAAQQCDVARLNITCLASEFC